MFPVLRNSAMAPLATSSINRFDNLFDRFFGDEAGLRQQSWTGLPLAMWEDDDHFCVEAELPGVAAGDVDLTVHNGMLSIRAERRPDEGRNYLYDGRSYGRFERVIALPAAVETELVQAALKDGVLSVRLPKSPEARPKKITLQTD